MVRSRPRRVLLLEENPDHRELIAEFLETEVEAVEVLVEAGAEDADLLLVSDGWHRAHGELRLPPARRHLVLEGKQQGGAFWACLREQVGALLEPASDASEAVGPTSDPRLVCALAAATIETAGPLGRLLAPFEESVVRALDPGALLLVGLEQWRRRWPERRMDCERRGVPARLPLAPGLWLGVFDRLVDQLATRLPAGASLRLTCGTLEAGYRVHLEPVVEIDPSVLALVEALAAIHRGRLETSAGLALHIPLSEASEVVDAAASRAVLVVAPAVEASLVAAVESAGRRAVCVADPQQALTLLEAGCRYDLALVDLPPAGPGPDALRGADPGMLLITWGSAAGPRADGLHLSAPPRPEVLAELLVDDPGRDRPIPGSC